MSSFAVARGIAYGVGFLLALCAGCSPFRPLLVGDASASCDLIRRAGRSTDSRLDAALLRLLEARLAAPADLGAAARAQAAALALAERRTQAAIPRLIALAADPDPVLRCGILEALARLGGGEAKAALERIAVADPHPRVRSLASLLNLGLD